MFIFLLKTNGVDLKKFNFQSDEEYLELSSADHEELEINIEFDILNKKIYQELEKYEVNNEPDFFITSVLEDELVLPSKEPSIVGKYYKIYKEGNTLIQAQYGEKENLIGIIEYCENKAVLHFTKNNIYYDEFLLSDYALVYFVLKNQNAIFIHSSCLAYKDNGILLIANSGTGKSTHANLWSQYEDVIRVNDDRTFFSKIEEKNVMMLLLGEKEKLK